jgi:hypothetical protein
MDKVCTECEALNPVEDQGYSACCNEPVDFADNLEMWRS